MSYVEGGYTTSHDALLAVRRLKNNGYRIEDLRLISNAEVPNVCAG